MMGLGEAVSIRGQHTTVIDNTILGNSLNVGIRIRDGSHSYIVNNRISGYYRGITLGDCYNNTLEKNIISENGYGVYFDLRAFFNTLEGNIISRNRYGVYFNYDSHNNKVTNNTITWNELFGVYCAPETYENQMYLNVFANNDGPNANDDGSGNYWNTTGFGNYWSNYNGTGVYYIPGTAGSIDYHPSEYNETVPSTTDTSSTSPTGIGGGPFDPIVILVAGIGIVIVLVIVLQYRKRG